MVKDTIKFLREYNKWRRGSETVLMPTPESIGRAIDEACAALAKHEREIKGWENKWNCAVELAARAEAELAILRGR